LVVGDRFVGHPCDPGFEHRLRELPVGREVQVSEEYLPLAHPFVFRADRLFDLDDHLGALPDLAVRFDYPALGRALFLIPDAAPIPGLRLDQDRMSVIAKRLDPGRGEADAVFVVFDLFWQTYDHYLLL